MPVGVYNQVATYWGYGVIDGFGKRSFATPISLMVRWQDHITLVLRKGVEEKPCRSIIWVEQPLKVGDYLALGDYTGAGCNSLVIDPTTLDNAFPIFAYEEQPSVDGTEYIRKAFLAV